MCIIIQTRNKRKDFPIVSRTAKLRKVRHITHGNTPFV